MNIDQALHTFIAEGRELLQEMEAALLVVQGEEESSQSINAIFRAAHTIKGSAGLFGLDFIVAFTHMVESVLDRVRDGVVTIDEALVALLLDCCDHIGGLVDAAAQGQTEDVQMLDQGVPLIARLQSYLAGPAVLAATVPAPSSVPPTAPADAGGRPGAHWHLSLRFGHDVLRNGMDPLSFLRYLSRLGDIAGIVTLPGALPGLAELDPECCYLGFEAGLRSNASQAAIEGAFDFVRDDGDIRIFAPGSPVSAYAEFITSHAAAQPDIGDILVHCGTLSRDELDQATAGAAEPARAGQRPDGPPAAIVATARQKPHKDGKAGEAQTVRVDADKLDRLIDLVGELITASASADAAGRAINDGALREAHSTLAGLVQEVRDSAMQLRMVKIGATFTRFQRIVHDVSRELGKDIELAISGEDTELDKTVVEKIADPLTHLVRNSMDHGIEPAAVRAGRGKPARGRVSLNAYHDSGSIVIEVGDDGGGLDRERIHAKAVARGLVEAGRPLADHEIYSLIFEPGFSTAEQVTNLSGRGVGMDVVKRNITALRGAVSVDSRTGLGTTVTIRLPLTLAIINGFQVAVGRSVFVLPLESVEECVELGAETGHDFAELRGQVLPFIRLREAFHVPGAPGARQSIVVVRQEAQRFGLIVDRLLGEAQTVIKPLAKMFAHLKGVSGSSILGSGDVALILDVHALASQALAAGTVPRQPQQPPLVHSPSSVETSV